PGEINRPLGWTELSDEQREFQATKMAIHAAMIDRMDQEIGRVIAQLESMKALENTLIFFLSDNGASAEIMVRDDGHDPQAALGSAATYLCLGPGWTTVANTPYRRHKTWVHEGGISTPLIAHWPLGIEARGELRTTPGHVIDLAPTIFAAAGIEKPAIWNDLPIPQSPGKSLTPSFARNETIRREALWWLHEDNRAIRQGDWKLVAAANEPWELYNLADDPAETNNLASLHPDRVQQLETQWSDYRDQFRELAHGQAK
ncbi:MAG: sulfatase-like hydrolase/transferase, partial [Planctomycetales bacterium]|nr:sulfatase-like hydrolase/transferase [Planctomycetales bacterium]